jgi:hypothetical protein
MTRRMNNQRSQLLVPTAVFTLVEAGECSGACLFRASFVAIPGYQDRALAQHFDRLWKAAGHKGLRIPDGIASGGWIAAHVGEVAEPG